VGGAGFAEIGVTTLYGGGYAVVTARRTLS
jgi:hypothetical protein